jgi:thymidylate synthase
MPPTETPYEGLLREVVNTGAAKGDRTGTHTTSVYGRQVRFTWLTASR